MAPEDVVADEDTSKNRSGPDEPSGRPPAENDTERGCPARRSMFEIQRRKLGMRAKKYLLAEVTTAHADALMLLCCLISGFLDSTIYYGQ